MQGKGNSFRGLISGKYYDRFIEWANVPALHQEAVNHLPLSYGMRVLDLGCGTASFGLMIAKKIGPTGKIDGLDTSEKQLFHAVEKTGNSPTPFEFHLASMDKLPFDPNTFDAVVSALSFHHVPTAVRRGAIAETARVLKPGGVFALVDVSRPRPGWTGLLGLSWFAAHGFDPAIEDHWFNRFPELFQEHHMTCIQDLYLNEIIRCQIFEK